MRVDAVIATLATYAGRRGPPDLISNGTAHGCIGVDSSFVFVGRCAIAGIPALIWILIVVAAYLLLCLTGVGRNLYAVDGNATAAQPVGIVLTARTGSGPPTSGSQGFELQSITAASQGVVPLRVGKSAIPGTILGALPPGMPQNGLTILGGNVYWPDIVQGFLPVAAVIIQQRRGHPRRRLAVAGAGTRATQHPGGSDDATEKSRPVGDERSRRGRARSCGSRRGPGGR